MKARTGNKNGAAAASPQRKVLGRYIVQDPKICHGQLTFIGTRIFVRDVLDQVSKGMDWQRIIEEWDGKVSREAIAEAVQLASSALITRSAPRAAVRS